MPTPDPRVLVFPAPTATSFRAECLDGALLGTSEPVSRLRAQIARVGPYFRAAVLTGEDATGADCAARALHAHSPARHLPFRTLDAANAQDYVRTLGGPAPGPDEGSLFLPELEQVPIDVQQRLLRRLRQRSRPVRLIAFSSNGLRAAVSAGRVSLDMAEALSAIRLPLPALRERREDLPALLIGMAQRMAKAGPGVLPVFSACCLAAAAEHTWPGNLTEVEAVLELLREGGDHTRTAKDLAAALERNAGRDAVSRGRETRLMRLEDVVQEHIRGVLLACHGNKLRAAEVLGISRSTLYRMLDSYSPERLPVAV